MHPTRIDIAPSINAASGSITFATVLFEDSEGIRLEVNFVPGKGLFENSGQLPLKHMPGYEDYPS